MTSALGAGEAGEALNQPVDHDYPSWQQMQARFSTVEELLTCSGTTLI